MGPAPKAAQPLDSPGRSTLRSPDGPFPRAEPVVREGLKHICKECVFIYCQVGEKPYWKDPNNDFRKNLKITAVPTLLKYGTVSIFLQLCWHYNSPYQNSLNLFWIQIWKGLDISPQIPHCCSECICQSPMVNPNI
uniref:Thioredoxin domain-containing protein 17 n=1 Tax=Molossus molossus TaxID=27622 RepID=A0A7J8D338_MOLMO|nr:thioredoxin domain containing 17 [Molossus molossus]